jgi:hypothetical protein
MAAPICAISFAVGPSRASSEACKLGGIANDGIDPIEGIAVPFVAQQTAFDDHSRQFFDKQWDTVGASGDVRDDLIWQGFARYGLGQHGAFAGIEAVEQ